MGKSKANVGPYELVQDVELQRLQLWSEVNEEHRIFVAGCSLFNKRLEDLKACLRDGFARNDMRSSGEQPGAVPLEHEIVCGTCIDSYDELLQPGHQAAFSPQHGITKSPQTKRRKTPSQLPASLVDMWVKNEEIPIRYGSFDAIFIAKHRNENKPLTTDTAVLRCLCTDCTALAETEESLWTVSDFVAHAGGKNARGWQNAMKLTLHNEELLNIDKSSYTLGEYLARWNLDGKKMCGICLNDSFQGLRHPEKGLTFCLCQGCVKVLQPIDWKNDDKWKGDDGLDKWCRVHGDGDELIYCDDCDKAFCSDCLASFFPWAGSFAKLQELERWQCPICRKKALQDASVGSQLDAHLVKSSKGNTGSPVKKRRKLGKKNLAAVETDIDMGDDFAYMAPQDYDYSDAQPKSRNPLLNTTNRKRKVVTSKPFSAAVQKFVKDTNPMWKSKHIG